MYFWTNCGVTLNFLPRQNMENSIHFFSFALIKIWSKKKSGSIFKRNRGHDTIRIKTWLLLCQNSLFYKYEYLLNIEHFFIVYIFLHHCKIWQPGTITIVIASWRCPLPIVNNCTNSFYLLGIVMNQWNPLEK